MRERGREPSHAVVDGIAKAQISRSVGGWPARWQASHASLNSASALFGHARALGAAKHVRFEEEKSTVLFINSVKKG